jgi:hypothetical protein
MLDKLSADQRATVYFAIVYAIENDFREGFYNANIDHPVYRNDDFAEQYSYKDDATRNGHFLALSEIARLDAKESEPLIEQPILNWQDFRRFLAKAHKDIQSRESAA